MNATERAEKDFDKAWSLSKIIKKVSVIFCTVEGIDHETPVLLTAYSIVLGQVLGIIKHKGEHTDFSLVRKTVEEMVDLGSDYQHSWDQGKTYSLEYVYGEVKKTIDSLISLVGEVKIRSGWDGKYRYLKEYT